MKATEDRIFVSDGIEYRLKKDQFIGDVPKKVVAELKKYGLVVEEKKKEVKKAPVTKSKRSETKTKEKPLETKVDKVGGRKE